MFNSVRVIISISVATACFMIFIQTASSRVTPQAQFVPNSFCAISNHNSGLFQSVSIPDTATILISVKTSELVSLFQADSSLGKPDRPFVANSFCSIDSSVGLKPNDAGLKNTFVLVTNKVYTFELIGTTENCFSSSNSSVLVISMIRDSIPDKADWENIFVINTSQYPNVKFDSAYGKLEIMSQHVNDSTLRFTFQTQNHNITSYNLDYSIIFQINNPDITQPPYNAIIDPLIINTSDIEPD